MLIYIHGFNSSALSYKAGLVRKRMIELGRAEMFLCPELPPSPRNAIGLLEHEIEAHGRENVSLIGSSLGGYYATWLAERHGVQAILALPRRIALAHSRDKRQRPRGSCTSRANQSE